MPRREITALSTDFRIAETGRFEKKAASPEFRAVCGKARRYVYPKLRANPFFGPNIKKLKGEFTDVYRYRLGTFRLFYTLREREVIFVMIDVAERKDAYR